MKDLVLNARIICILQKARCETYADFFDSVLLFEKKQIPILRKGGQKLMY